jgi:predicted TIM-barrel fold metal-dependent hydrolase
VIDLPPTTPFELCGDSTLLQDQLDHGFDAPSYLRAMDAQGIDAAVLFPSMGLFVPFLPELDATDSAACCRAYNEWIADYCATDPGRLTAVGVVPQRAPELTVAEARHAAELGLAGVLVRPNHLGDVYLDHADFDPLYTALEETGLVLRRPRGARGARADDRQRPLLRLRGPPRVLAPARADDRGRRDLPRRRARASPGLRVAFLESGTGWMPYWLSRLDEHREWMESTECADLSLSPSEYFARQCVISSDPEDRLAAWVVSEVGADHVIWASDFPHPDAAFPRRGRRVPAREPVARRRRAPRRLLGHPARLLPAPGAVRGLSLEHLVDHVAHDAPVRQLVRV